MPTTQTKELSMYSPLIRQLLLNRGIATEEEAQYFLSPDWEEHTHDPYELANMDKAVGRIVQAIENKEHIVIFSDYDTDGIPGAVIFHDFLRKVGHENFEVYIPHRVEEGFGLNMEAIEGFVENGADVLITIDCGIRGNSEVFHAQENGIDVIITDHHMPGDDVPDAYAIVNPKMPGCEYSEEMLCGAAVVFKLVQALAESMRDTHDIHEGWEKWLLDMVGIATLSDMVPLKGENRVFAHYGLTVLRKSRREGLKTLLQKGRVSQKYLSEDDVGFTIGPRINAASRMDVPKAAFDLLVSDDTAEAEKLAEHLEGINNERKGVVAAMVKEIKKKLSRRDEQPVVIATGDPEWSPGLLGLAASSVVGSFDRPAFIWGRGGGSVIKGSCRSDGRVNLVDLMAAVPDGFFLEFGGHAQSGGFSIDHEHIHTLEEALADAYAQVKTGSAIEQQSVDAELTISDISWKLWDEIQRLAPFGMGNPKPLFKFSDVVVQKISHFGKQSNHLKLRFSQEGKEINAIEFFTTNDTYGLEEGETVSLHAHLEKDVFGRRPELRFRIVDILQKEN
ncbi:MAG: single-stranded-DNA-specific exonuclease RecJ [Candidatus Paceibacterota bacterium]